MDYKKVIKFYFNRKSPLPEDKKAKRRMALQTRYWQTFSKSEKAFFWVNSVAFIALVYFLMEIIIRAFKG
jgi:cell division protein FtsL|tara:strand:+ start:80 stop:289 length:210 start_codon:yes stop_codon:yes gene_type:complete